MALRPRPKQEGPERINNPTPGSIVHDIHRKFDVYIVSGQYMGSFNRISNFWYYRRVMPDGSLSRKVIKDYGAFSKAEGTYKISQVITVINT